MIGPKPWTRDQWVPAAAVGSWIERGTVARHRPAALVRKGSEGRKENTRIFGFGEIATPNPTRTMFRFALRP
jgi:hypothetical protein